MIRTVRSRNRVPIRLTPERWAHIVEEHCEMAGLREETLDAVASADWVIEGNAGALMAVRFLAPQKALVVPYRELSSTDGFIITAFMTRRIGSLERRRRLWQIQS